MQNVKIFNTSRVVFVQKNNIDGTLIVKCKNMFPVYFLLIGENGIIQTKPGLDKVDVFFLDII